MMQDIELNIAPFRWWAATPRGLAPVVDDPCDDWARFVPSKSLADYWPPGSAEKFRAAIMGATE